jgi:hypothetical protein
MRRYNFKKAHSEKILHALEYIDDLPRMLHFHDNLSLLRKTKMLEKSREMTYLSDEKKHPMHSYDRYQIWIFNKFNMDPMKLPKSQHPIFLYDDLQLSDTNATRLQQFKDDLVTFLGLTQPLTDPLVENLQPQKSPSWTPIDICHYDYRPLRKELIRVGTQASFWIRTYFLQSPDVHVSSQPYFVELLKGWARDPCNEPLVYPYQRVSKKGV